jgi:hypothetical protein
MRFFTNNRAAPVCPRTVPLFQGVASDESVVGPSVFSSPAKLVMGHYYPGRVRTLS